ncbi:MAG: hypothetical protein ACD_40C00170G0001 [uncultured bacterium]|nr:MAG: hypothetical protein ACD_40C00170G0001 [uncultured bacterium]
MCQIGGLKRNRTHAIRLRREGKSYLDISRELGIAKSTLSGWLRNISLTDQQRKNLNAQWKVGTSKALELARATHRRMKLDRHSKVETEVKRYINSVEISRDILEMLFVGLYLGDGFKNNGRVGLGNADPDIVLLFVTLLRKLYLINESKLRVQVFARADQIEDELLEYWSSLLEIPVTHFYKTQFDKRTANIKSRDNYHGVCAVVYADIKMQWRILGIGKEMIEYVRTLEMGS